MDTAGGTPPPAKAGGTAGGGESDEVGGLRGRARAAALPPPDQQQVVGPAQLLERPPDVLRVPVDVCPQPRQHVVGKVEVPLVRAAQGHHDVAGRRAVAAQGPAHQSLHARRVVPHDAQPAGRGAVARWRARASAGAAGAVWIRAASVGEALTVAPVVRRLRAARPGLPLVLTHTGLPADRSPEGLAGWERALRELAACPNAAIKISGLGVPGARWSAQLNREVVLSAIDVFGTARAMFASNFPVDGLCASFDEIYSGFREIAGSFPAMEQRALFHDNALRIYAMG